MLAQTLPHLITGLRIAAAPLLVWCIITGRYREALVLLVIAGVSDWCDGYAARHLGTRGKLGVVLDPMADKVMLFALFCALPWVGLIPLWFFVLAVLRDLVIVVGALLVRVLRSVRTFRPTILGKVSTFFQIVYVLLALSQAAFPFTLILWLERTGLVLSTIFTVLSGVEYIRIGIRYARGPSYPVSPS